MRTWPARQASRRSRPARRGLTLTELMITLVILGVLAAVAAPSLLTYIARKRVQGVADEVMTTLRYARSLPLEINDLIYLKFGSTATTTCYAVYSEPGFATCNCERHPATTCTTSPFNAVQPTDYRTVVVPRDSGVTLTASAAQLQFDRFTGMPRNGATLTVDVASSRGGQLRIVTNPTGRPQLCSVSGHPTYPACAP